MSTPAALVLLVAGLVAGFAAGRLSAAPKASSSSVAGTYDAGYAAAKKKLEDLSVIAPEPDQVTELSGPVVDVKASSFTMRVDMQVLNPLVKDAPEIREVMVGPDTVLTVKVKRDDAAFKADMDAYDKALAAASASGKAQPAPPSQYEDKKITLAELKAEDHVVVKTAHDVKHAASFDAASVQVGFESRTFVPAPIPESRPPAPSDNRPPPPKAGEMPPSLPPPPNQ